MRLMKNAILLQDEHSEQVIICAVVLRAGLECYSFTLRVFGDERFAERNQRHFPNLNTLSYLSTNDSLLNDVQTSTRVLSSWEE